MKNSPLYKPDLLDVAHLKQFNEYDGHDMVIVLTDPSVGLEAFVAIHSTSRGIAHGGTRMQIYKNTAAALVDALELSKAMTYKSALANLPYGGAKGVIMLRSHDVDRDRILEAYAKRIEQLNGLFHTGTDVGLTEEDVKKMSKFTQYMLGVKPHEGSDLSTSKAAALGTYYAIKTAAKHRYGTDDVKGKTIAIKGLGKLGGELGRLLYEDGTNLLVSDIDNSKIDAFIQQYPNVMVIDPEEIHSRKVEVFSPCALGHAVDDKTIDELNCDIICGGANNQLAHNGLGDQLAEKGILYAPDYVVNAGGLIFVSEELEKDGFDASRVSERLEHIKDTLAMIFERSDQEGVPTNRIADAIGKERIQYKGTA